MEPSCRTTHNPCKRTHLPRKQLLQPRKDWLPLFYTQPEVRPLQARCGPFSCPRWQTSEFDASASLRLLDHFCITAALNCETLEKRPWTSSTPTAVSRPNTDASIVSIRMGTIPDVHMDNATPGTLSRSVAFNNDHQPAKLQAEAGPPELVR